MSAQTVNGAGCQIQGVICANQLLCHVMTTQITQAGVAEKYEAESMSVMAALLAQCLSRLDPVITLQGEQTTHSPEKCLSLMPTCTCVLLCTPHSSQMHKITH